MIIQKNTLAVVSTLVVGHVAALESFSMALEHLICLAEKRIGWFQYCDPQTAQGAGGVLVLLMSDVHR